MIVGDPHVLALESEIIRAFENPSLFALGFFVIHVAGFAYGVREPDATLLACSRDVVRRRLQGRGRHVAPFADAAAGEIAEAVRRARYFDELPEARFFGLDQARFDELVCRADLIWAPDGEEGFDDGSYVLQLDDRERVRVIAFRSHERLPYDPTTLREVSLGADAFYRLLEEWARGVEALWSEMPKEP